MSEKQPLAPPYKKHPLHLLMHLLKRLMPSSQNGENERAVRMLHRLTVIKDLLKAGPLCRLVQRSMRKSTWPVLPGSYMLGDPSAAVAICTLTTSELIDTLVRLPAVAIAGRLYTPNLGIEHIIRNVISNRAIRFLLLCGKESPIFQPAQALSALLASGVTSEKRIIGALGPLPVLQNLSSAQIATFRRQVELVDCTGVMDPVVLAEHIQALIQRNPGPFAEQREQNGKQPAASIHEEQQEHFIQLKPGGKRQPLSYDPKGFFIITVDRARHEIVVRHYLADQTPAHEMRSRSAESLALGLLREDLISQLSHASYLGSELAKAEAALRFGWQYEQDRPLRFPLKESR